MPTSLRLAGVHALAEACHQTLGAAAPGGAVAGIASGTALVLVQTRIARARRQSRRTRATLHVEPWLGHHQRSDGHDLVVIPAGSSIAYALEGHPPQIVVSQGLASALSSDELGAVIRHERCHLDHGHQRYLELALVADAALAPLRFVGRSSATLRLSVERWADETAADQASRTAIRNALAKAVEQMLVPVPAFSAAETIGARLVALDTDPSAPRARWRLAAVLPTVTLTVTIAVALLTGSAPIHHGVLGAFGCCRL
jgi:beta-lactamase regulating signal transducer with metallopeptidase domain